MTEAAALLGMSALVTGGGSGIGLACAYRLAEDGAAVTSWGRTEQRLRSAADEIGRAGPGPAMWISCDVTDEAQVAAAVAAAGDNGGGRLDIVVACAGGSTHMGPIPVSGSAAWRGPRRLPRVGCVFCIQHPA